MCVAAVRNVHDHRIGGYDLLDRYSLKLARARGAAMPRGAGRRDTEPVGGGGRLRGLGARADAAQQVRQEQLRGRDVQEGHRGASAGAAVSARGALVTVCRHSLGATDSRRRQEMPTRRRVECSWTRTGACGCS